MISGRQSPERLAELLADQAVFGLNADEHRELKQLQRDAVDPTPSEFELLAADLLLSQTVLDEEELPTALSSRLESDAEGFFALQKPTPMVRPKSSWDSARERMAWVVAAAMVLVAVLVWRSSSTEVLLTTSEQRAQLIAKADDLIQVDWLPSKDPAAENAQGNVVWSSRLQQGFMTFRGLDANDPKRQQYQLWIIDGERNAAQPVDGGVFDIPTGQSEVVIPISAKLKVFDPRAFAVTIEKPGGVVVSNRERLPLLASVGDE